MVKKVLLFVILVCSVPFSAAQAAMFRFDGTLDLYNGAMLTESAAVTGEFSFTGVHITSELFGTFTGEIFGAPVTGFLAIPTLGNPIISALDILWNGNELSGELELQFNVTSLSLFDFVSLDREGDGISGSVFDLGANGLTSLALSGQFSEVPLPSAFWLFGTGLVTVVVAFRRRTATNATLC